MQFKQYIILLTGLLILIFIYSHIYHINKINNQVEILQAEVPDKNKIQDLLVHKQPTIFRQVLYGCEPIVDIFDVEIEEINEIVKVNKHFSRAIKEFLEPYGLPFSTGWNYYITDRNEEYTQQNFILQENHRHLIAQITGVQRIYLASPNQIDFLKPLIKKKDNIFKTISKTNFWNKEETSKEPFNKLQYIEIILREGNILYIPNGWWYLQKVDESGLVMEAVNTSLLSIFG